MKTALITLALLSLFLAGCVIDPNGGYGDRGHGNVGWNNGDHGEYHAEHGGAWGQQNH